MKDSEDEAFRERFETAKRNSVGQLLFKCSRLFNEQAIARLRKQPGLENLRVAHTSLFPHIELEGTRLTELARRLGISKQAVGQLVEELESMGALKRIPDPNDGRAKLVCFADEGKLGLFSGLAALGELEQHYRDHIGEQTMDQLHDILLKLLAALEAEQS